MPDDVYEQNQKIAGMRRRIPIQTKASPHLFYGILRCPICGGVMGGKRLKAKLKTKTYERVGYVCPLYARSGPRVCPGLWISEREAVHVLLPVLKELIQTNLRGHLRNTSDINPLHAQMEREIKAELAKVDQSMKNLVEAVKQGALSMDQVREENTELQDAKRRMERRLQDLQDTTRVADELSAILETFDHNLESVLTDLMQNRLRFNTFVRVFFSAIVVDVDRPGPGWRKGKRKGELPERNGRIVKFALEPHFAAFVDQSGLRLPAAREIAERQSPVYRSSFHGSPSLAAGRILSWEFLEVLNVVLANLSRSHELEQPLLSQNRLRESYLQAYV